MATSWSDRFRTLIERVAEVSDAGIAAIAPTWGQRRVDARMRLKRRHFEAAAIGRRTDGWSRRLTDANAAAGGASLAYLRAQARDLIRNNPWARRGMRRIVTNTVGWGIRPKPTGLGADLIKQRWKDWAETTECDAAGRLTFYGLQKLVMRTVVESGEVIVRRRYRKPDDGLSIPMQLQVLEPDYIDTGKDGLIGQAGGPIIQGIEFDAIGRRVAYWLFDQHPGGRVLVNPVSRRIPADGVIHVYEQERPGQVRGPSWFSAVDMRLHDFDDFEDATLMKQRIAACFAAFVVDSEGGDSAVRIGNDGGTDQRSGAPVDAFEPGMIIDLPGGRDVKVANPPTASDHQSFSATTLRSIAAGLGVTYEDLTGDYGQSNYSSARMARNAHMRDVDDWRWNMLIPQFCVPAWDWMIGAMNLAGDDVEDAPAKWTPPPLPMLDPDKEASAASKQVRIGMMTPDEMVREQGFDPDEHWQEYAESQKRLDDLGIVLDSDVRRTSGQGQLQVAAKPAAPGDASVDAAPASSGGDTTDDAAGDPADQADDPADA